MFWCSHSGYLIPCCITVMRFSDRQWQHNVNYLTVAKDALGLLSLARSFMTQNCLGYSSTGGLILRVGLYILGLEKCAYTLYSEVGLYSGWAYTQSGLILRVGLYLRWAYTGGGLILSVGLYGGIILRGGLILRVGLYSGVDYTCKYYCKSWLIL